MIPISDRMLKWLLLGGIAVGILLRLLVLSSREFWYDEILSLLFAAGQKLSYSSPGDNPVFLTDYAALLQLPPESGLKAMLHTLKQTILGLLGTEPHPPLFYLAQHVWLRLTGSSETSARSLNLLLSLGAIGSAYGLGRSLLNVRMGWLLAALVALNPFFFFHSVNFRMYAPVFTESLVASWALSHLVMEQPKGWRALVWGALGGIAMAAGLLTSYLFLLWMVAAGITVLILRSPWIPLGIAAVLAIALSLPWMLWGAKNQLGNADLNRFAVESSGVSALVEQGRGSFEVLGVHLMWGDWASQLPTLVPIITGVAITGGMALILKRVVSENDRRLWILLGGLGMLPFLLALGADVISGKSTVPWGLGRSVIFVLPGMLSLMGLGLYRLPHALRNGTITLVLCIYAGLNVADVGLRSRHMFHDVAAEVATYPGGPSLVLLNSKAWGHVLRIAYYLPPDLALLAVHPSDLPNAAQTALAQGTYAHVFWLEADRSVWKQPDNETKTHLEAATAHVLETNYRPVSTRQLRGTMDLDRFTLRSYDRLGFESEP